MGETEGEEYVETLYYNLQNFSENLKLFKNTN